MTSSVRTTAASGADGVWRPAVLLPKLMMVGGWGCVILGGLAAAVTGPLGLRNGSWLAAYLVLVCGVGSFAIGAVQARSAPTPVRAWIQLSCWAVGNIAVIAGSLTGIPAVVDSGVVLLVIALLVALAHALRPAHPTGRRSTDDDIAGLPPAPIGRLVGWVYRCLLVLMIVSAPVGAVLAHLRSAA